jgi:hypothetical protein
MKTLIIALAGVLILSSCSTSHSGMDYAKHRREGAKLQRQATNRNRSGDLTKWRCPGHRHRGYGDRRVTR